MFITGGFNVYPAEIEQSLLRYPGVAQAAVIGIADERLGKVAMAFLLPAPGQVLDSASVIAWCRVQMANYKVPRRVQLLDAMPRNAAGKVTKNVLREWAWSSNWLKLRSCWLRLLRNSAGLISSARANRSGRARSSASRPGVRARHWRAAASRVTPGGAGSVVPTAPVAADWPRAAAGSRPRP
ncbi:2-succinylbenzoate--CoA ligase [Pseudomonas fluorescens]|nr:2-succinylbenzoate--CoA ligase [Pseudomonas fluorescens]VVN90283.1 2-succinylbenzoate--CoA ligase [Pseudomonas fluorescens]VVO55706.1 2-succinylbenzoate--CoA ligase [Pseudomonas fluorescens]